MKVYEINWEYASSVDIIEDACALPFDGLEGFRFDVGGIDRVTFYKKLYFQANFKIIPNQSDFPSNDLGLPIMSKKMIDIIERLEEVEFNKIPITFIDDTYLDELFDERGDLFDHIKTNHDYCIIQLLNYTEAFDYTNSVFKYLKSNPSKIGVINKLVLKKPLQGFPPVFRIEAKPSKLFFSESAKELLEGQNIKGCLFEEIKVLDEEISS